MKNINKIVIFILLGMVTTFNLQAEIITHNGFTYGTVTSPYTGRVWLDRNLGASQVCTAYNDSACYGDYYQWGRGTDGHEKAASSITSTQATDVINVNNGGKFITSSSSYNYDWGSIDSNGSIRSTNWNPCPSGYKIPSINELLDENISNRADAYSKLKLPSSGHRDGTDGRIYFKGDSGRLWTSLISGDKSGYFYFGSGDSYSWNSASRSAGFSIRCTADSSYTPSNQSPIPITSSNQTTFKDNAVTLNASNSIDNDGNITAYLWSENGTVLSTDVNFTKYDFSVGVHTITLKVTDDDNASSEANVTVTINDFPKENIYANGTFTNSIDSLNTKRVYTFTLDEKSQVDIKASSDVMQVGAWVIDANNTRFSTLADWESGVNGQFYYDAILEAGTYALEFFAQNTDSVGDFSFSFDMQPYVLLTQKPFALNIPTNILVTRSEYVLLHLDIEPISSNDISKIQVTSDNLPTNWSLSNPTGYGYQLYGTVETSNDFSVLLNITDGNYSQEHTINFQEKPFSVSAVIGEGEGGKLAIKQYSDTNNSEPFKVAFRIDGISTENIQTVLCQFNNKPILNMQAVYDNSRLRYTCDASTTPLMEGASSLLDFMNKLESIPEDDRYMSVIVKTNDATTLEDKVLQNIQKEVLGEYLEIKNLDSSLIQNDKNISIGILTPNNDYTITTDISNKSFNIDYDSEVYLNAGKWSLVIDNHELLVEIPNTSSGLVFVVNKNILNEDIVLKLSYAKNLNDAIKIYTQKIKNASNRSFSIATGIIDMWTRIVPPDTNSFELYDAPSAVAVRGTTFKMDLTPNGIDYNLYEGALDINDSSQITNLKTMQEYNSKEKTVSPIVQVTIPSNIKQYFKDTSLYQADINSTIAKLDINTNLDKASYTLIGDNVIFGDGKINRFENVLEGNYTLQFLNVFGYKKPADVNLTFNINNLQDEITSSYQKMADVYVDGVTQENNVDINISEANIKIEQLQDESIFTIVQTGDKNSSLIFSTLSSTINVDVNGTTIANIPLATNVKIAIAKDGQVKPTISGALLPKEDFPLGTEVKIIDNKVRFIIPMNQTLEF